jgi:hypothetical protein
MYFSTKKKMKMILHLSCLFFIFWLLLVSKKRTTRGQNIGHLDVKKFDISQASAAFFPERSFEMDGIQIGSSLASALHRDQPDLDQLLDVGIHALAGRPHILSQAVLAGEALIQLTGILEQHGIHQLGAHRNILAHQDEIGHARPAALCGDVRSLEEQVPLTESLGCCDMLHTPPNPLISL